MSPLKPVLLAAALAAALVACDKPAPTAPPPPPLEVSADAVGYFCGMLLADHEGPKGQIFLASRAGPLWFSSVRDTIAFLRLPGEARDVAAVYVSDMGRAAHWDKPEPGAWVEARAAWFVVNSAVQGGMGAPEAVPFSNQAAADAFQQKHGGKVVRLDAIEDRYVLGPVDLAAPAHQPQPAAGAHEAAPPDAAHAAPPAHAASH